MTGPMQALCGSILILATAGFATFASGDLLVANKSADSMTRIDVASGQTIGSFATDPGPHEIEVDPAGQRAAISNYGSEDEPGETLTLVDLRTSSVTTIDLAPRARPHGIAWMPDGRRLVVTTEGSNTLSVVDLVERRVVDAIETGGEQPHMVVVDRSGRFAWVTQIASGSVSRIDLESGSVVVHRTTGEGTEGLALSGDEEQLWVTNRGDGSVSVRDPETLEELGRLEVGGMPIRVELDPGDRYALVVSATGSKITKIDRRSLDVVGELGLRGHSAYATGRFLGGLFGLLPVPVGVQFVPAGDVFYVANSFGGVVVEVGLAELDVRNTLQADLEPDGMAWIP